MAEMRFSSSASGAVAVFFELGLVHRRRVEVAQLATVVVERAALVRQVLQNLAQGQQVVVAQLGKGAPAAVFGRDRIVLDPGAVHVLKEIVRGLMSDYSNL